jgi:5-methylcytosine-specific restriction endonuclease McrA
MNNEEYKLKKRIEYYKNRDKRLIHQREYDKTHKEIKRIYDRKRYDTKLRALRMWCRNNNFDLLLEKYKGCQLCNSTNSLEIHHIKYTKKIEDCMLLCFECHKKIHRKPLPSFEREGFSM